MAKRREQQIAREVDEAIAPTAAPCPSCPKCPHSSAKREKAKSPIATAMIGAALGTIGFAMATFGGRKNRR